MPFISAGSEGLLAVATLIQQFPRYGLLLLGLGLLIAAALGVVLYLISREGRRETEEMRRLVDQMRKIRERHEQEAGATRRPRARRHKG
jgi:hypothetical protein